MLPPFASVDDYEDMVGTPTARTRADLDAISTRIRGYCHWVIWPKVEETLTLDGPGRKIFTLPTKRLHEILTLTELHSGLGQLPKSLNVLELEWSSSGLVWKSNRQYWTCRPRGLVARISHGYEELPADICRLTLDLATRQASNPIGLKRNQVGQRAEDYSTGILEDELAFLDSTYRRRV